MRVLCLTLTTLVCVAAAFSSPVSARKASVRAPQRRRAGRRQVPAAILGNLVGTYGKMLDTRPLITKASTSALIFSASDIVAQKVESSGPKPNDNARTLTNMAIGGGYFGPAAHFWYSWITKLIPGNQLVDVFKKAALGQLIFGPIFTCIFFAVACVQSGAGIGALPEKIRRDLIPVQISGCFYWPFVDLVSFRYVPVAWIPLFINCMSFIWTIYLSVKTRSGLSKES